MIRAKWFFFLLSFLGVILLLLVFVFSTQQRQEDRRQTVTTFCEPSSSGQAMPVGDITGWHQVFADDFHSVTLDTSNWYPYSGQPAGDPNGWWDPSHVIINDCLLTLKGYKDATVKSGVFVTGGVGMTNAHAQTYGKYLVRMRADKGDGISVIALLWPLANVWPPEVDFYEDGGGQRASMTTTLHCGPNGQDNCLVQKALTGYDFSQWHTLGIEWTSGKLVYTIDGTTWATVTSGVPSIPMVLDLQTQSLVCEPSNTCIDPSTPVEVDMQIAWVVAYAPSNATSTQKLPPPSRNPTPPISETSASTIRLPSGNTMANLRLYPRERAQTVCDCSARLVS